MRKFFLTAFVLAASLVVASTGLALEKTAARFNDDSQDGWAAGTQTCTVSYYNTCTGWIWIWSGWSANDTVGTAFEGCGTSCDLSQSQMYFWSGAPAGYGFTGTAAVYAADANSCPTGPAIASQALLPLSGWNVLNWGVSVPSNFVLTNAFGNTPITNPAAFPTEHPAAGPTGPAACGTCYPIDRTTHTFYYGTSASPLCPGSSLADGSGCDAEWLHVAFLSCVVSVEDQSWGAVKNLYR
jgi:hypothetical protein